MGLKENIKKYRSGNDMTLEDVAEKVGVSRQTIQKYESGVISNIPSDKIEKLAEIFSVTPSELMGWNSLIENIRNSDEQSKLEDVLRFIGCDIGYKSWIIPPKDFEFDSKKYYSIKYEEASFNITTDEYLELINNIKSYLRFQILELKTKHKIKSYGND